MNSPKNPRPRTHPSRGTRRITMQENIAFVVPVVLRGLVDEVAISAAVSPAGAFHSAVMDDYLAAGEC